MICYVCQKEIKEGQSTQRLTSEIIRHERCGPMTKNFQKAFPNAWTNKYIKKEEEIIEEPKPVRRLLRIKKGE